MKIISMDSVVGSDTLLQSLILQSDHDYFTAEHACDLIRGVMVTENIWQSTANNLAIPEGLVCDVEYKKNSGHISKKTGINSTNRLVRLAGRNNTTAIKVTGKQDGYMCEWEKGE